MALTPEDVRSMGRALDAYNEAANTLRRLRDGIGKNLITHVIVQVEGYPYEMPCETVVSYYEQKLRTAEDKCLQYGITLPPRKEKP